MVKLQLKDASSLGIMTVILILVSCLTEIEPHFYLHGGQIINPSD
jgi:hypothetical protein